MPNTLANPKPLALSNHLTRAGSSGACATSARPCRQYPQGRSLCAFGRMDADRPRCLHAPIGLLREQFDPCAIRDRALTKVPQNIHVQQDIWPPLSDTTKPNPLTGSNHFTTPDTISVCGPSLVISVFLTRRSSHSGHFATLTSCLGIYASIPLRAEAVDTSHADSRRSRRH